MQTANSVLRWSFYISGMTGLMIMSGIFASWFIIEMFVILVDISA